MVFDSSPVRHWARIALAAALSIGAGSCSFTLDFDECVDDDDCQNDAGEELVCNVEAAVCEARPTPSEVVCDEVETCSAIFGEAAVCGAEGRCTNLASELCTKVVAPEDADPDEILWVGSILATSPPFDDAVVPIENAIELAIEDFNSVTSLADGRKVGWIACDSRGDAELAVEAAEHLIEDVGVPAIIGPALSGAALALRPLIVDSGTFLISPTATTASITDLDDDGLIWRTISSDVYQAAAIADRLASMDPAPQRVLVFAKEDAYGLGLFSPVTERFEAAMPGVPIGALTYPDPAGLSASERENAYSTTIATGFPQDADAVVFLGTSEVADLIEKYLVAWEGSQTGLPRFLVSHGAVPILLPILQVADGPFRPTLMAALEGVAPITQDPANFEDFNIRYRVRFSDLNAVSSSSLGYDAAIVTLLALVAADEPRGVDIARAMPRLADAAGTPLPFTGGQQFIANARDVLVGGGNLDVSGVSGPLDFDLVTGEVRSGYVGWDVERVSESSVEGRLQVGRVYTLDDAGVGGSWSEVE